MQIEKKKNTICNVTPARLSCVTQLMSPNRNMDRELRSKAEIKCTSGQKVLVPSRENFIGLDDCHYESIHSQKVPTKQFVLLQ